MAAEHFQSPGSGPKERRPQCPVGRFRALEHNFRKVAHLPELGHWDAKALTSLVGLAHWSRDSGRKQDQCAIRGGRGIVRRALYLCLEPSSESMAN